MANDVTISIDANSSKFNAVLTEVNAKLRALPSSTKQATSGLSKVGDATKGATTNLKKLAPAIQASDAKLDELIKALGKVTNKLAALPSVAKGGKSSLDNLGNSASGSAKKILGLVAAYATLRQAVQSIGQLIQVNSQFEDTMAQVKAVTEQNTGFTIGAFQEMEAEAKEMGASTRFSASQAAEGLKFLSQAGFTAKEATSSLEGTLKLAQAGNLDLGRSADIVSNIMTAFGAKADDTQRFVDVLAKTAATANTTVEQLGQGMKFAAPIAGGLGISIEETAAAMGILSNAGLQSEMAGTGVRMMLTQLTDQNSKAVRSLGEMGLAYNQINPQANSMTEILQNLSKAGVDASNAYTLFGARAGGAVTVLTQNNEAVTKMKTSLENANGAVDQMSGTMDDTFKGSLLQLKSVWEDLLIKLGDMGVMDTLRGAIIDLTKFLKKLANSSDFEQFGKSLRDTFESGIQLVKTIAPPLVKLVLLLAKIPTYIKGIIAVLVILKLRGKGALHVQSLELKNLRVGFAKLKSSIMNTSSAYGNMKSKGVAAFRSLKSAGMSAMAGIKGALVSTGIGALLIAIPAAVDRIKEAIAGGTMAEVDDINAAADHGNTRRDMHSSVSKRIKEAKSAQDLKDIEADLLAQRKAYNRELEVAQRGEDNEHLKASINTGKKYVDQLLYRLRTEGQGNVAKASWNAYERKMEREKAEAVERRAERERAANKSVIDGLEKAAGKARKMHFDKLSDGAKEKALMADVNSYYLVRNATNRRGLKDVRQLGQLLSQVKERAEAGVAFNPKVIEALTAKFFQLKSLNIKKSDDGKKLKALNLELDIKKKLLNAQISGNEKEVAQLKRKARAEALINEFKKKGMSITKATKEANTIIDLEDRKIRADKSRAEVKRGKGSDGGEVIASSSQSEGGGGRVFAGSGINAAEITAKNSKRTVELLSKIADIKSNITPNIDPNKNASTVSIGLAGQNNNRVVTLLTQIKNAVVSISDRDGGTSLIKVNEV